MADKIADIMFAAFGLVACVAAAVATGPFAA